MSKPYRPSGTKSRFYVPPTLAADFTEFLDGDIPNMVMDFTVLKDWYDQFAENYEEQTVRGELYADTAKSRYSNTDNNMNIRCDINSGIRKGDMLIGHDNPDDVYILDWAVALQHNNAPSRALRCNFNLTIQRYRPEITDARGYLVEPEGFDTIVDALPANAYFYDGRQASFYASSSQAGVAPDVNALVTVQYNTQTKNIRVDDRFVWGGDTYQIVDISHSGMHRSGTYGTLLLQTKEMAGGITG